MNKFVYGERSVYEKDGRYIKYLDGEFAGEDSRANAFNWLYAASPYQLNIANVEGGVSGTVLNKSSLKSISSATFLKHEGETDSDVRLRLLDWAERYVTKAEISAAVRRFQGN
jgi:hypothetical protein